MVNRAPIVVVDTNVFSANLLRSTRPLVELYRPILAGRRFLISLQTLAEILYGLRRRDWGTQRLLRAVDHIGRAEAVWPGPAPLDAYVALRVACERAGHALGQAQHDTDRWIAATAVHLRLPLVSHDRVFGGYAGPDVRDRPVSLPTGFSVNSGEATITATLNDTTLLKTTVNVPAVGEVLRVDVC